MSVRQAERLVGVSNQTTNWFSQRPDPSLRSG
jgi:hypothetical protein